MKKALFWILLIPATLISAAFMILESLCTIGGAVCEVTYILFFRYECWVFDVPKGSLLNCPWKKSLKTVWVDKLSHM